MDSSFGRLELRRRCVPADRIVALKTNLRKTTNDAGIVGYVLQANQRRSVDAGIWRSGEVIATRPAEPEVSDKRRREYTRQSKSDSLRSIVARAEGITV